MILDNSDSEIYTPQHFMCPCDEVDKILDRLGYHITGCKKDGLAIRSHNCFRNTVAYFLRSLGLYLPLESIRLFDNDTSDDNRRPNLLIFYLFGGGGQINSVIAVTGVHGQSRRNDDDPDNPLEVRFEAKMTNYHDIAERSGFLFTPAIFSYTGQTLKKVHDFVTQQVELKIQLQK